MGVGGYCGPRRSHSRQCGDPGDVPSAAGGAGSFRGTGKVFPDTPKLRPSGLPVGGGSAGSTVTQRAAHRDPEGGMSMPSSRVEGQSSGRVREEPRKELREEGEPAVSYL